MSKLTSAVRIHSVSKLNACKSPAPIGTVVNTALDTTKVSVLNWAELVATADDAADIFLKKSTLMRDLTKNWPTISPSFPAEIIFVRNAIGRCFTPCPFRQGVNHSLCMSGTGLILESANPTTFSSSNCFWQLLQTSLPRMSLTLSGRDNAASRTTTQCVTIEST